MKSFLHHILFPRESNNHRAKILHHKSIFFLILVLVLGQIFFDSVAKTQSGVLGITADISSEELLTITNRKRQEAGQAPLVLNQALSDAAFRKAQDMFAKNYWAHNSPEGTTPWVFIKGAGYDYMYAGENLARGFTNAPDTVTAWMNSPGHRDNMLSPNYKDVGFAVASGELTGDETILVVEMFGSRNESQSTATVDTDSYPGQIVLSPAAVIPQEKEAVITLAPTAVQVDAGSDKQSDNIVASVRSQPLIDRKSFTKEIGIFIIALLLFVLIIDIVVIKQKRIVRIAAHSLDHIIYFVILLLSLIIIGRGIIL